MSSLAVEEKAVFGVLYVVVDICKIRVERLRESKGCLGSDHVGVGARAEGQ